MKKIILVGPTASGKTYIKEKFLEKGFKIDVSWTSRPLRMGEVQDTDYHFISKEKFEECINDANFYEWVKYEDHYYGTSISGWQTSQVFIMETDGISKITPEDRKECLIIYVNTPQSIRVDRMKKRSWDKSKILSRINIDFKRFKNFTDYDLEISSVNENKDYNEDIVQIYDQYDLELCPECKEAVFMHNECVICPKCGNVLIKNVPNNLKIQ